MKNLISSDIQEMIRVNHAGETGAIRIYEGQLWVLGASSVKEELNHMLFQEKAHQKSFSDLMVQYRVRPTFLSPLWHVAGFALGATTALLGKKAAMACTVAVEEVIDDHYQLQLKNLKNKGDSQELQTLIEECRQDEISHKNKAFELGAAEMRGYTLLTNVIKTASRLAIWLSKKI